MPFFIPIMIALTALSMAPSLIPQKQKEAKDVITQTGTAYYDRQTWRTRGKNVYSNIPLKPSKPINWQQYLFYIGLGLGTILTLKIIMSRRRPK